MTAREKTPQEIGKEFETDFQGLLKTVQGNRPATFHRFYDTHSAGSFMPKQPGDYLMIFQGQAHLFELKSSAVHKSLSSGLADLLDRDQAAFMRMWARAGAKTHILFLAQETGIVEWWSGKPVAEARAAGKRIKSDGICLTFTDFATFSKHFFEFIEVSTHRDIFPIRR